MFAGALGRSQEQLNPLRDSCVDEKMHARVGRSGVRIVIALTISAASLAALVTLGVQTARAQAETETETELQLLEASEDAPADGSKRLPKGY